MPHKLQATFSSERQDWATPWDFFKLQESKYGPFDLDVCATLENSKCQKFFTPHDDALSRHWPGHCWMNPPYGREIARWLQHACRETYDLGNASQVIALLPARTDTSWWHDFVLQFAAHIDFIRGRIRFEGAINNAPFPSAVVVFRPKEYCEGHNPLIGKAA